LTYIIEGNALNTSNFPVTLEWFIGNFTYDTVADTPEIKIWTTINRDSIGGYLTSIVFNNPKLDITRVSLIAAPNANFEVIGGPFGKFNIGANTGGSFQGGGNPNRGVDIDTGFEFIFGFSGTNLGTLTTTDFLNALSAPSDAGQGFPSYSPDGEALPAAPAAVTKSPPGQSHCPPLCSYSAPACWIWRVLGGSGMINQPFPLSN